MLLDGVRWSEYLRLNRVLNRNGYRVAYDRGRLEATSPSFEHDSDSGFVGLLVVALTQALGLEFAGGGSTTMRKRERKKGLEPDQCFWIAHEAAMRGQRRYDPEAHPPPDLALEVEVSRSALNRLGIHAELGVPEVWRLRGERLTFLGLREGGYVALERSAAFPMVAPADLPPYLARRHVIGANATFAEFAAWLRMRRGPE